MSPVAPAEPEGSARWFAVHDPNTVLANTPAKSPPHVLIVEDHVQVRHVVARALRAAGFATFEAADAGEARTLLARAIEQAETCGADGLRARAAAGLRELGVDVPEEPAPRLRLTTAERRVAMMAADGLSCDEIAMAYFMTTGTVTSIVESVYDRLGVTTQEELHEALAELT